MCVRLNLKFTSMSSDQHGVFVVTRLAAEASREAELNSYSQAYRKRQGSLPAELNQSVVSSSRMGHSSV